MFRAIEKEIQPDQDQDEKPEEKCNPIGHVHLRYVPVTLHQPAGRGKAQNRPFGQGSIAALWRIRKTA